MSARTPSLAPRGLRLAGLLLGCLLSDAAAGADELPPAPSPPPASDPYAPPEGVSFGSDLSASVAVGSLLGSWPDGGVHGFAMLRYDAFLVDRDTPGARLGLGLWGGRTAWPRQRFTEEGGPQGEAFDFTHFGAMVVLRGDPAAPVSGSAGLGFGRLDLDSYYEGPLVIPTLGFEGGARFRVGGRGFLDLLARAHWGTSRSTTAASLHEWWMLQVAIGPGLHLR